jgi:ADP-ribose pyrophosphatase
MTGPDVALAAYDDYKQTHPELFVNPPGAAFEIVFEPEVQRALCAGLVYQDDYYVLLRDAVRFRDGSTGPYIRLIAAAGQGGAAVLPVVDNRVVLIKHQRHATRSWHWEIPRGFGYIGEPPEVTARREIREELDVPDPEVMELGSVHPDTGASNVLTKLYIARLPGLGQVEANEGIDGTRQVTAEQLAAMVQSGEITDSFTLAAILQARLRGLLGERGSG